MANILDISLLALIENRLKFHRILMVLYQKNSSLISSEKELRLPSIFLQMEVKLWR